MGRIQERGKRYWQRGALALRRLADRFWLLIFRIARDHLPEYYIDKAFESYLTDRMEALVGTHGEAFVMWVQTDAVYPGDSQGREYRSVGREIRDGRL